MNKQLLDVLREKSITVRIESEENVGSVPAVASVIKVLKQVQESFSNFMKIEFLKNKAFKKVYSKNRKVLETFLEGIELLVVDSQKKGLQYALAPDIIERSNPIFTDEILEWKVERFEFFKKHIFNCDFSKLSFKQFIAEKYNEAEIELIFRPLIKATDSDTFTITAISPITGKPLVILPRLSKREKSFYIQKNKKKVEKEEKLIRGYFKVNTIVGQEAPTDKLKKTAIKEILDFEYLEHPIYPLKLDTIRYKDTETIIVLNQQLRAEVTFKNDKYYIDEPLFGIKVNGETREEAEEMFQKSFYRLYRKFYHVQDGQGVSARAAQMGSRLRMTINQVLHNQ